MDTVFVSGWDGVYVCNYPVATFWRTKISELQYQVQLKTGVMVESQRLVFGSKELQSQRNGVDMTFRHYGIGPGSDIKLVARLPGGGGGGFVALKFTDITSEDKFKPIEFAPAPEWRFVREGLNFEGLCKNETCTANNEAVMVPKGFYDSDNGKCNLNDEIDEFECPMCQIKLNPDTISGVGIYKCKLEVRAKPVGLNPICFEMESTDKFKFAQSLDEDDRVFYKSLILIVKRLELQNSLLSMLPISLLYS